MPEFLHNNKLYHSPVEFAMNKIGGMWKMPIFWRLKDCVMRYSELKRAIPRIIDKMLASPLRQLQTEGFIHREVYAVVPPKVEYSMTEKGRCAVPIIDAIRKYGIELMEEDGLMEERKP